MVDDIDKKHDYLDDELVELELYQKNYPDIRSCKIAIGELEALLDLPKGTSCFFSDIHGQGNKFKHIMHNKAGVIKRKIDDTFHNLTENEKVELSKLCFYPKAYITYVKNNHPEDHYNFFMERSILNVAQLIQFTGSKITRKSFSDNINTSEYNVSIQELVSASNQDKIESDEFLYQKKMIAIHLRNGIADELLIEMVRIFKQLLIYKYIINGDIPDRGADTAEIIDILMQYDKKYKNVAINWGNHDLMWMGAAAGCRELMLELIRIQLRYGYHSVLENDYNIDLSSLYIFARNTYKEKPGKGFKCKGQLTDDKYTLDDLARMQKALVIILWKIELRRYNELVTENRLKYIHKNKQGELVITIDEVEHLITDQDLPTLDLCNHEKITLEEYELVETLMAQIKNSKRFQKHMRFLARRGSLYHLEDGILSYHAIVPLNSDGTLKRVNILGQNYYGKELFDTLTSLYKGAFNTSNPPQQILDLFYMGWKGSNSWTFGKSSMQTLTRSLLEDKKTHKEYPSEYYEIIDDPERAQLASEIILENFNDGHCDISDMKIFNGHVPVRINDGDEAVKANGIIICGDGGFSEAYGDIGFCMISTSKGLYLKKLGPGVSQDEVIGSECKDIVPVTLWQELYSKRKRLCDSSAAIKIMKKIKILEYLIRLYEQK